ncbi:FkbM family methyltransferase [Propionispira raffinosivorans]|uniref:FkbM family methyltransferase n=1 Tax=Propionispira raffinosivorans TaxID=86959 RepID=UPI000380EED2|nr:FkbM family methyltransferase [Propionispira raffinosivorans]
MQSYLDVIGSTYAKMQDNISRELYANRLLYNLTGDRKYMSKIFKNMDEVKSFYASLSKHKNQVKILFGAGYWGKAVRNFFPDIQWYCYADNKLGEGKIVDGLKVISYEELSSSYKDAFIVVSTRLYYREIEKQLLTGGFKKENILLLGEIVDRLFEKQYFDLPAMPHDENEVFVDAGGFDGKTALRFCEWADGQYKQVYVFEPNEFLHDTCKVNLSMQRNCNLITKGLWNKTTTLEFVADIVVEGASRFTGGEVVSKRGGTCVPVTSLDECLKDEKITFIKFDIEGSELKALEGAEQIIRGMKPKLAICMYHKKEDLWEIPAILLKYNPEYKFYMRHYSLNNAETVLYAF